MSNALWVVLRCSTQKKKPSISTSKTTFLCSLNCRNLFWEVMPLIQQTLFSEHSVANSNSITIANLSIFYYSLIIFCVIASRLYPFINICGKSVSMSPPCNATCGNRNEVYSVLTTTLKLLKI